MENKREMSKEYKHTSGLKAKQQSCGTFDVENVDGDVIFQAIPETWFNRSPVFGWEKVEEPFKFDEWCYLPRTETYHECIFRYGGEGTSMYHSKENYIIDSNGVFVGSQGGGLENDIPLNRATPDQIERILSISAKSKGFDPTREKITVSRPWENGSTKEITIYPELEFSYSEICDTLSFGGVIIYSKGTWAKIVKEKVTEPQVEAMQEAYSKVRFDMGQPDSKTAKEELIKLLDWYTQLTPSKKVSVWSKDGQWKGLFDKDNEQLVDKFLEEETKKRTQL